MAITINGGTGVITGVSVGGLPDGVVDSGTLATNIDATKLADGTVTSTELQYINSLSSNAQTQISGAGGAVVLGHTTASSSASVIFSGLFTSAYDNYVVYIGDFNCATNGAELELHVSDDSGSSYETAPQWYLFSGMDDAGPSTLTGGTNSTGTTPIIIGPPIARTNGGSQINGVVTVHIGDPLTSAADYFHGTGSWRQTSPDGMGTWQWGGGNNTPHVCNAIKFEMSTGNIETGQFTLVGYKNSV